MGSRSSDGVWSGRRSHGAQPPAGVLWDMDGTLIDSEKLWTVSLRELMERLGGRMTDRVRESVVGSNLDRTIRTLLAEAGHEARPAAVAEAGRWLLDRTGELFRAGLPWRPGARGALRAVFEHGLPTALVTSTDRELTEIALDTLGREFFDVTVCGDEVEGRNKPDPWPYLLAARSLGVDPAECVVVEDSLTGLAAAEAAGCGVLVVPCEVAVSPGPRRVVRDSLIGVDVTFLGTILAGRAA